MHDIAFRGETDEPSSFYQVVQFSQLPLAEREENASLLCHIYEQMFSK